MINGQKGKPPQESIDASEIATMIASPTEHRWHRRAAPAQQRLGRGDLVAVGGQQQPAQQIQRNADSEDRQDHEADPDQHRIHAQRPTEAAGDTRDLPIGRGPPGAP